MTHRRPKTHPAQTFGDRVGRDESGAIAPMFGLLLVPLMVMAVFGIDFERAMTARSALQDAVDAAGLAVARLDLSGDPLTAKAKMWTDQNLQGRIDKNAYTLTAERDETTRTVTITAKATVLSLSGNLTHVDQFPVIAVSKIKYGPKIELALVLDNTYSMVSNGSTKLADLKTAATNLVDTLQKATSAKPDDLKVGVVPFSVSVNVGAANQTASWISASQPALYGPNGTSGTDIFNESNVNRFTLFSKLGTTWGGCVESRPPPYDVQETAPNASTPGTMFVPYFAPDETGFYPYGNGWYNGYNDYIDESSSDGPLKGSSTKYSRTQQRSGVSGWGARAGPSPSFDKGPNMGCPFIAPILPLTTNMDTVRAKLTEMKASGDTHIPIGMVWGWHVLSPNAPFATGAPYQDVTDLKVIKVAVLVTDGANQYSTGINGKYNSSYTGYGYGWQNRLSSNAFSSDPAATTAINSRLTQLCANMKAAKIQIYTVPVQVTDTTIKTLLKTCASDPANGYIEVTTPDGMNKAFASIANSISNLRISH